MGLILGLGTRSHKLRGMAKKKKKEKEQISKRKEIREDLLKERHLSWASRYLKGKKKRGGNL